MPIVEIDITGIVRQQPRNSNDRETVRSSQIKDDIGNQNDVRTSQSPDVKLQITITAKDNSTGKLLPDTVEHTCFIPLPTQSLRAKNLEWRQEYTKWLKNITTLIESPAIPIADTASTISVSQKCQNIGRESIGAFNEWISYENQIKSALLLVVSSKEYKQNRHDFRFILRTRTGDRELDLELQRLPFHTWEFLKTAYPDAEIALSTNNHAVLPVSHHKPQILVILGNDPKIDLIPHQESIGKNIPADLADVQYWPRTTDFPIDPIADLNATLKASSPQVVIFIGHSQSTVPSTANESPIDASIRIWLSKDAWISPEDSSFQEILRGLKNRGLIFAAFISCDGLRIAPAINALGIPYVLVSREILPVHIAKIFLDRFLYEAVQEGIPIHIALSYARKHLQDTVEHSRIEGCPNASNFPVIFQIPDLHSYILNPKSELVLEPEPEIVVDTDSNLQGSVLEEQIQRINKIVKTYNKILMFALILIFGLILALIFQRPNYQTSTDVAGVPESIKRDRDISLGDKPLLTYGNRNLDRGFKYFNDGDYISAKEKFDEYLLTHKNSPEILIASNNSFVANLAKNDDQKPLRVAVGVPLIGNIPVGREILAGIAMYQKRANANGTMLQIVIGRDDNKSLSAKKIAQAFVDEPSILGVIGHNASEASVAAKDIYSRRKMVMLSPTSFDPKLSNIPYIYRMVSQMDYFATQLQKQIDTSFKASGKIARPAICLDPDSPDNESFKKVIIRFAKARDTQYKELKCDEFRNISSKKIQEIVKEIKESGSNAIIVAPHINSIDKAMLLLKEINLIPNVQLFGSPSFYTHVAENAGVDGLIVSVPYFPTSPKDSFGNKYSEMWGEELHNWRTPMAYAGTMVVTEALKNRSSREGLNSILSSKQVLSTEVIDSFYFNESHELQYEKSSSSEGVLIKLEGQKFRLLKKVTNP